MVARADFDFFVPGRLCLLGEHSDWAGAMREDDPSIHPGACLVHGTDQGLYATAHACAEFRVATVLPDGRRRGPVVVAMDPVVLEARAAAEDFFSYACGVAAIVARERQVEAGVALDVRRMDLPIARGLSSSAAVCVLTARAFNHVHGLGLDRHQEMDLAYRGELLAGSRCGRMDQACAYGKRPVALRFDGDAFHVAEVAVGGPIRMLIVDLERGKDTRRILADLHRGFRENPVLRDALGCRNEKLVDAGREAIRRGDAACLGGAMREAQLLFDRDVAPACPSELTAPRLHDLLAWAQAQGLVWGGKGVGSQGDGCAQFVCRGPDERDRLAQLIREHEFGRPLPLTIGET